jgi:hypothetical protein
MVRNVSTRIDMHSSNGWCHVSRQRLREPHWYTDASHARYCASPEYRSMFNISNISYI